MAASETVSFRSDVYILEKKAVSESTLPNTAYIRNSSSMNGIFIRSTANAATMVATPNISINGESSSYTRK